ncbi:MAG: hypothetical protein AVDCRST_MAG18-4596 [uncultured Thermomicrobiales bacterium]|uniref:Uncharacterized protein n=1 Tax=uncultured Thermomicrobiales bacterium TaxID=1645740 RepID=A0A6J4VVJ9_9BACT|nr:MAG: hypothetical protein AVDCRST_MAG18-4596 [uncultured Thermomicrobiales bacterium]
MRLTLGAWRRGMARGNRLPRPRSRERPRPSRRRVLSFALPTRRCWAGG